MDLIDRQAAIDAMMALQAEDDEAYGCHIPEGFDGERAKEALEHLPPAQPEVLACGEGELSAKPEQKWIPCNWHKDTENLPDECKSVLICIKDKIGTYVDVSYRTDYNRWERYGRNINVVAWMPLPEAWRGEEHG